MARKKPGNIITLPKGILGNPSGSRGNLVVCSNGVIYLKKLVYVKNNSKVSR